MSKEIQAVVYDIGNVLVGFDFDPAIHALRAGGADSIESHRMEIDLLKNEYESGRLDRITFVHRARNILEYQGSDAEFVRIWQEIFTPNEPVHRLVERLRGRLPQYLLSNTSDLHMEYIQRTYPVFARFDGATYSYVVGCMKPDPAIYRHAIRSHGLDPERTVFLDDLGANVAAAERLGFQAFQYRIDRHKDLLDWFAGRTWPVALGAWWE